MMEEPLTCNGCKHVGIPLLAHKIIPSKNPTNDIRWPKYTVMIKGLCSECGNYIKFVKQTPAVIERLNRQTAALEESYHFSN